MDIAATWQSAGNRGGLVALSAIRHSQFEMVRASFPVFILGWTIGAFGVECDGMTSLLERGNTSPLSSTRHVASDQSADVSAHSKAALTGTEFRGRLSPECRYAETDWW